MLKKKRKPVPPGFMVGHSGFHFLRAYDSDNHFLGFHILQWQPGVKMWCLPGSAATLNDIPWDRLQYWEYFCECPIPEDDSDLRLKALDLMNKDENNAMKQDWLKEFNLQ